MGEWVGYGGGAGREVQEDGTGMSDGGPEEVVGLAWAAENAFRVGGSARKKKRLHAAFRKK